MQLVGTEVWAEYRITKPFRLPFHSGSMFRGVLGRALRAEGCAKERIACAMDCERPKECSYARLFDPLVPEPLPHRFLRGQHRAPQPMIPIFPGPGSAELREGESISFGLRILGPLGNGELELVFAILERMSGFDWGFGEGGRVVFEGAGHRGRRESPIEIGIEATEVEQIEVGFETPTWIEQQGELLERMAFQPLFRSIYRRLCILCALYGQTDENEDEQFARLDALAGRIAVVKQDLKTLQWNRRSLAREREHPLRGLVGRVVFAGAGLEAFLPILRLAEKAHIGKSTSHGLGRVRFTGGK
jgi:CRISPR-associated endoribonuclease Cas6